MKKKKKRKIRLAFFFHTMSRIHGSITMAKEETTHTIQSFHQCSSLITLKLSSSTNYSLWKSQVIPMVRSLGIEHHLKDNKVPNEEIVDNGGVASI